MPRLLHSAVYYVSFLNDFRPSDDYWMVIYNGCLTVLEHKFVFVNNPFNTSPDILVTSLILYFILLYCFVIKIVCNTVLRLDQFMFVLGQYQTLCGLLNERNPL